MMQHKYIACNKQYFNYNFAGSPTANTAIPSSDEPLPLSPCSPASVLVSGLSPSPQTNQGKHNFFACMKGEKVVNGIWQYGCTKWVAMLWWCAYTAPCSKCTMTSNSLCLLKCLSSVVLHNIPAFYISMQVVIHSLLIPNVHPIWTVKYILHTRCLCRVHNILSLDHILHMMFILLKCCTQFKGHGTTIFLCMQCIKVYIYFFNTILLL